jgi:hypothetical protein
MRSISRTDEEWEAMREPFRRAYIDQDMSLKQATQYLAVHHGFAASERQWERKKENWNFSKYQKRETRQQFIEQALSQGMNMEDILNASDIPVEGPGGDDRAARRNWRRYVKRERSRSRSHQPNSQHHSPTEGPRRSFDAPAGSHQDHHVVEKKYDVNLPDGILLDQTTGTLPDSMMLEATSAEGLGQSPVQFLVVSEVNAPHDTNPAPEIFFSTWNDAVGELQNHGPLPQPSYTNYADFSFQPDATMMAPGNDDLTHDRGVEDSYENYQSYQQLPDTADLGQQTTYNDQGPGDWNEEQQANITYNPGDQQLYGNVGDVTNDSQPFPQIDLVPQEAFDPSFDPQPLVRPLTPRTRAANDYFQSITADPLAKDLSDMVDVYTDDIHQMVTTFLGELPKHDSKVLQKIQEGLQARRDLCLRTVSKEIESQARNRQRVLESITQKCRNLEQIMAEKGINTRAELIDLKARSNPRQPVDNGGALDMSQWNTVINDTAINAFTL